MDADTLRGKFLDFFQRHAHKIMPSDSLVPTSDPSVLFTSAGMNQFKNQFLGIDVKSGRVATCQKCLRTGDLERVGKTSGHHTFFEMLGNFSFGDYFKKEAIQLAWEFLTQELKIDKSRLWVSVYTEDDESFSIWLEDIGINKERILKFQDKENFWPSEARIKGPNGPCGPCSEIFFDLGTKVGCGNKSCSPACDCGRFVEVWNLVFTQFERKADAQLYPLPQKNIDTGMGLERLCAVMQNVETNYETDLFTPIIGEILTLVSEDIHLDELKKKFRVRAIADHLRAVCFGIADGIYPSNEERGYVIRSLIRRASAFGRELGIESAFLYKLVDSLVRKMQKAYSDLGAQRENIASIIQAEEERFIDTLKTRVPEFIEAVKELRDKSVSEVPAETLFKFYDTFGLPWDLMEKEAERFQIRCDKKKFSKLLDKQRKRSRGASKLSSSIFEKLYDFKRSDIEFVDAKTISAKVIAIFKEEGKKKSHIGKAKSLSFVEIILDKTPFYAESGGQVGDTGFLENEKTKIEIINTLAIEGAIVHKGKILKGEIAINDEVRASIDYERRLAIMRNHTATHLLQAALRKILGPHVRQQGSLVTDSHLRFDFTHPRAIKNEELGKIEDLVNSFIVLNDKLNKEITSLESAKARGALAFFGDRYEDSVRVVSIGDYSKELCGGSHLESTGQIGFFKIMKESSIASGIRRIQACTEKYARDFQAQKKKKESEERLRKEKESREKELRHHSVEVKEKTFKEEISSFLEQAGEIEEGVKCISIFLKDCDRDQLRRLTDFLEEKAQGLIIVLGSILEKKGIFVVKMTDDLVKAGYQAADKGSDVGVLHVLIARISQMGALASGGGRSKLAQGSCDSDKIQQLIGEIPEILKINKDKIKK
ncbi:MAG: alanine--tRNA ligase [Candidatus Omnitrophota bacterium]